MQRTICLAMGLLIIGSLSARAKDLGPELRIPDSAKVQLVYNGHFSIKVLGERGSARIFQCACASGEGNCEVNSIAKEASHEFVCLKGKTGTCSGVCTMTTGSDGP
jgi:hypothetical protein